jgi:hypothetical protein
VEALKISRFRRKPAMKGKASFLKKEAKNFFKLGRACFRATGPKSQKFLRRF